MYGLLITFQSSVALADLEEPFNKYAGALCEVPGLVSKAWLQDDDVLGGFHVFESKAAADSYIESDMAVGLRATEGFDDFEVRGFDILDELSRTTGLAEARPLALR